MDVFDDQALREFFKVQTKREPFDYQISVGRALWEGRNVVLRAPTGAGKTWAVLVPFFFPRWRAKPSKLIYALPVRTLANGVYREACVLGARFGWPVTIQTGEQPDDPFFDHGKIIITTYDQVLSGLLDGPYGLSDRLHNINTAAIAGALVVFDEFHLMEPHQAFLTAAAGLHLFRQLCQSVWMTATATQPLENLLRDALDVMPVPASESEETKMFASLPSVANITRYLVREQEPLTSEMVLKNHSKRSLVLLNTVGRAQEMYRQIRDRLKESGGARLLLLHSRFFKQDRAKKERELQELFGKDSKGNSILVATQVVEAGLDISCEDLHTELCPMNALMQRAGRCARFKGESGTVHVYPLPEDDRAWLPYGDNSGEDVTLAKTRELLGQFEIGRTVRLDARQAAEWVQTVHGETDEVALRKGWHSRLSECLERIHQNAILRNPKRIADLIRGDDTDRVRVVVTEPQNLPDSPGKREGISFSRWSLSRLLREGRDGIGWFWDGTDDSVPWKPLRTTDDLKNTYAVALVPRVASYDDQLGLRLGQAGSNESPERKLPERPGYALYKRESWADHALEVAKEAAERLARDGGESSLLFCGLKERYNLDGEAIRAAVRACALLHDLGKLQETWQRWAEAAQKAKDPSYCHNVPLAHTDFNPDNPKDWERERSLDYPRPPHAAASAYYGLPLVLDLLRPHAAASLRDRIVSACAASMLAHHGGWLPSPQRAGRDLGISRLHPNCGESVATVLEVNKTFSRLGTKEDKRRFFGKWLDASTSPDNLAVWWPIVALLTRTLRLADQRATAERGPDE